MNLSDLPSWTAICLAVAVIVTVVILLIGVISLWTWRRGGRQLEEVRRELQIEHGQKSHRMLHAMFEELKIGLRQKARERRQAAGIIASLLDSVTVFHDRQVLGTAGQWEELRDPLLDRARWPIHLARGGAGWVVLIGLAGTVLGFSEAMPALRDILLSNAQTTVASEQEALAPAESAPIPVEDKQGNDTPGKLARVLDEVRGIFYATFGGVVGALLLSILSLAVLEPAFERYAHEVDLLGARWLVPLIHPPDSIVDDALRSELKAYFDEIGRGLERQLAPLVHGLKVGLEAMSELSSDFTSNIAAGGRTLHTFHQAVEELGGVAKGAVDELKNIVTTSKDFLGETQSLQEEGRKQLESIARALGEPVNALAGAAAGIEEKVESLDNHLFGLDTASQGISQAIEVHRLSTLALKSELAATSEILGRFLQAGSEDAAATAGTIERLETLGASQMEIVRATAESQGAAREQLAELGRAASDRGEAIARTAGAIESNLGQLNEVLASLLAIGADLARQLDEGRAGDAELREVLATTATGLAGQAEQVGRLLQAIPFSEQSAAIVSGQILPRLDEISKTLTGNHRELLQESRVGNERLAAAMSALGEVNRSRLSCAEQPHDAEGSGAGSPRGAEMEVVREGLDRLRVAVDALRLQLAQQSVPPTPPLHRPSRSKKSAGRQAEAQAAPAEPVTGEVFVEFIRLLEDVRGSMREVVGTVRGAVAPIQASSQAPTTAPEADEHAATTSQGAPPGEAASRIPEQSQNWSSRAIALVNRILGLRD